MFFSGNLLDCSLELISSLNCKTIEALADLMYRIEFLLTFGLKESHSVYFDSTVTCS